MQFDRQLNSLFASINDSLLVPAEYICLSNFLITGSNIVTESNCTLFNVRKVYGWNGFSNTYSLILFDASIHPTVGVWQDDCLTLYQDISVGYLRLSYSVKEQKSWKFAKDSNILEYFFVVDISSDGICWHRYSRGEYRAS